MKTLLVLAMISVMIAPVFAMKDMEDAADRAFGPGTAKFMKMKLNIKEGSDFVDFEVTDLAGLSIKTADIRKDKAIIIQFVRDPGTQSPINMNALDDFAKKHPEVVVLDVVLKGEMNQTEILAFYEKAKILYTPVLDLDEKIGKVYGITLAPIIVVANKSGKITTIIKGFGHPQIMPKLFEDAVVREIPESEQEKE